jgi:hypothetical protein
MEPRRAEIGPRPELGGGAVTLSLTDLQRLAGSTGFRAETLEKVLILLDLLDAIRAQPRPSSPFEKARSNTKV